MVAGGADVVPSGAGEGFGAFVGASEINELSLEN